MRFNLTLILIVVGVSWGLTAPLSKIAVSTGHHYLGLLIWQIIVMVLSLGIVQAIRKKYFFSLSINSFLRFGLVALMGSLLPNSIMYKTYFHLQSGVMSILIAMVPMFAFPLVLVLRMENLEFKRLLGVLLGAIAIALIILPQLNLTNMGQSGWIAFGLLSPLCYAIEGVWINKIGLAKLDPVELVLGSSILGLIVLLPVTLINGYWISPFVIWGPAEIALTISSLMHSLIYVSYLWLIGRAGVVFASQTSYICTASGVGFAMLMLGEGYSIYIWGAVILMLIGLIMVRPTKLIYIK